MSNVDTDRAVRTLDEAMAWLSARTNYERQTDWSYSRLGFHLDAFREFLARIGQPHQRLAPTIHVAGTKGKGSTCLMLEAMYRAAGLRTGVYLSPHLESVTERIRVDGAPVSDTHFAALLESLRPALERFAAEVRPVTFFEILTAMAFAAFIDARAQVVVLEVGLGGRLDATNVVDADVAVITSIGYDHTDKLGHTLAAIAAEKAGILKSGRDAVIGAMPDDSARESIAAVAATLAPPPSLSWADRGEFATVRREGDVLVCGSHRVPTPDRPVELDRNLACALHAAQRLGERHPALALPVELALREATTAALPARCEKFVREGVTVVLDCAHNADSFRSVGAWWSGHGWRPVLLLGANRDKLTPGVLAHLADATRVIVTTIPGARAATADELRAAWQQSVATPVPIDEQPDPAAALARAIELARAAGQPVVITGSVYLAGALRPLLRS